MWRLFLGELNCRVRAVDIYQRVYAFGLFFAIYCLLLLTGYIGNAVRFILFF